MGSLDKLYTQIICLLVKKCDYMEESPYSKQMRNMEIALWFI